MGRIAQYVGKYVSAPSASTKLDVDSILSGCDAVDNEVANLTSICNEFSNNGTTITPEALSFDGITTEPIIEEYTSSTKGVADLILGKTASIREEAMAAYNRIQEQLNIEAQNRDREAAKAAENN